MKTKVKIIIEFPNRNGLRQLCISFWQSIIKPVL